MGISGNRRFNHCDKGTPEPGDFAALAFGDRAGGNDHDGGFRSRLCLGYTNINGGVPSSDSCRNPIYRLHSSIRLAVNIECYDSEETDWVIVHLAPYG